VPELVPFRGLRYDAFAVPDLATVLCPPYDVISASERTRLAALDERNAVHVELPLAEGGDAYGDGDSASDAPSDQYQAAARRFSRWRGDGTLRLDDTPQIYVYEQRYRLPGGDELSARGFFCRLRLEPFGPDSGVRPHEATMSGPKEDRFRLLSAVRANLSPVLLMYDGGDEGASSQGLMDDLTADVPDAEAVGPGGLLNRLWLADPAESVAARDLIRIAASGPLTIADGHHRYETALRYMREPGVSEEAEWVLALVYDAHSGGLSLLPWHRVLRNVGSGSALLDAAADWFRVHRVDTTDELTRALGQGNGLSAEDGGVLGLWTRDGGAVLEVDRDRIESLLPPTASETLRWLDVNVVSSTLAAMIGSQASDLAADGRLTYISDSREATAFVDSGDADATFLLRPTPIEAVLDVAAAGEHMPAKSTFFHPKAATGIVFNAVGD
jgi:uncharacterized protein (DUF1015 family)